MQRMKQMRLDPELVAMNRVSEVMKYLGNGQKRRVIDWAKARFNLIDEPTPEAPAAEIPGKVGTPPTPETPVTPVTAPSTPPPDATTELIPTAPAQPIQQPQPTQPITPAPASYEMEEEDETETDFDEYDEPKQKNTLAKNKQVRNKIFANFETIEDLFLMVNAKKVSHRILLVAAYLQEKGNLDEVSSLDINSHLKRLGYGVSNITTLINGLLKKNPPQIVVTKKKGDTKQSRRKFRVTERGFKDAQSFILNNEEE